MTTAIASGFPWGKSFHTETQYSWLCRSRISCNSLGSVIVLTVGLDGDCASQAAPPATNSNQKMQKEMCWFMSLEMRMYIGKRKGQGPAQA